MGFARRGVQGIGVIQGILEAVHIHRSRGGDLHIELPFAIGIRTRLQADVVSTGRTTVVVPRGRGDVVEVTGLNDVGLIISGSVHRDYPPRGVRGVSRLENNLVGTGRRGVVCHILATGHIIYIVDSGRGCGDEDEVVACCSCCRAVHINGSTVLLGEIHGVTGCVAQQHAYFIRLGRGNGAGHRRREVIVDKRRGNAVGGIAVDGPLP